MILGNEKSEKLWSKSETYFRGRKVSEIHNYIEVAEIPERHFMSINIIYNWAAESSDESEPEIYLPWKRSLATWL